MIKLQYHAPAEWISHIERLRGKKDAAHLDHLTTLFNDKQTKSLEAGLGIANILLDLSLDTATLAAALLYPAFRANELKQDIIADSLNEESYKLLQDVLQMQSMEKLHRLEVRNHRQIENLRKMLLSIVSDVRAVLVILADRLWQLRQAKTLDSDTQRKLAEETLHLYAPLANRLGVWQLKWEMEDLCLRYLRRDVYDEIAKGLAARRQEREHYLSQMITLFTSMLNKASISGAQITGRVKHIFSIYQKMLRKNVSLDKIYDTAALRVLVPNIEDCYAVLSMLQNTWQQIPEEFDDYINRPKANGYRSIHCVIIGPENRMIEVQIRTHEMHQESELGVAAHWRYKEGILQTSHYEAKIALLRQIIAWQKEVAGDESSDKQLSRDVFSDRIYVFTPAGDIIDLEHGATPLDFAYHIHSEIGHRCRGAKIDGNIVPLTYSLKTGERVEIITTKEAQPSRDWLNPQRGYLKTARARAKVQHWFKLHDTTRNIADGRAMLERELKKLHIHDRYDLNLIAKKLNFKSSDDLLAGLASGNAGLMQIINHIRAPAPLANEPIIHLRQPEHDKKSAIQILGVNNLLTQIARCCKPLPGDPIVGYVTRDRGISIHRKNCGNLSHTLKIGKQRLIEVNWGVKSVENYPVDLLLRAIDRPGLLRDITALLATEKINVLGLQTHKAPHSPDADIFLSIEVANVTQLKHSIELLQQIPGVVKVVRRL